MCTNIRYITNRSLHYDLFKPLKMPVPCGKCEECQRANRNEWFCRSFFEWKRSKLSFFYTLTFNQDHLPVFMGVPYFSKRVIQLFMKKLRKLLSEFGIKLKYIVTCEFGELKGRPHYHVLFFLDSYINPFQFYKMVQRAWTDHKGESIGFVKYGDNVGVVNSDLGIQYVTKYVTKDFSQTEKMLPLLVPLVCDRYYMLFKYCCKRWNISTCMWFDFDEVYYSVHTFHSQTPTDDEKEFIQKFVTKIRRIISNLTPFHLQSTRLGSNMVEVAVHDIEKIPLLNSRGEVKMYNMPRFIKRLLWYDCIEGENSGKKDTFVLNDEGIAHMFSKIQHQIDLDVTKYQSILINASSFPAECLPTLNEQIDSDFKKPSDVVFYCQHFDLDLNILSIYKNVFRGRVCTLDVNDINHDYVLSNWKDYAKACLYDCSDFDFGAICKDTHLQKVLSGLMWNLNSYFQVFERALQILNAIDSFSRLSANEAQVYKDKERRKLRQYMMLNY